MIFDSDSAFPSSLLLPYTLLHFRQLSLLPLVITALYAILFFDMCNSWRFVRFPKDLAREAKSDRASCTGISPHAEEVVVLSKEVTGGVQSYRSSNLE